MVAIKQMYHPYWLWEDYLAGMWNKLPSDKEDAATQQAIQFTGDHLLYGSWMIKATQQWPITCEHNLSDKSLNRKAFIGHCAVSLAIGTPEYITRKAWWFLSKEQQDLANDQAQQAIEQWESNYILKHHLVASEQPTIFDFIK